jgi:DNA-directed RNA polymerase specialized sigma24 family protein
VLYVYFDDMTREETAVLVGLSVPTVRKRLNQFLYRARKAFGVPSEAILATAFATLTLLGMYP